MPQPTLVPASPVASVVASGPDALYLVGMFA